MRKTEQSIHATSFHGTEVKTTLKNLREILGQPDQEQNDGEDKVNFDWHMETETGDLFTVYDWKEYRPIKETETICWHIGGRSKAETERAAKEILTALNNLK